MVRDESAMSLELLHNSPMNSRSEEMPSSIQGTESLMQLMADLSMEMNGTFLDTGNSRLIAATVAVHSSPYEESYHLQSLSVETIPLSGQLDDIGNSVTDMSFSQATITCAPVPTKPALAYPNLVQSAAMVPVPPNTASGISKDDKPPARPSNCILHNAAPSKMKQNICNQPTAPASLSHDVTAQLEELERAVMNAVECGDAQ
jgi:hypothetical protein